MSQNQDSPPSLSRLFFGIAKELFTVDVRSLAVLRIALACLIMIDLINRFSTIDMLYTNQGVLKDGDAFEYLGSGGGFWSLYWIQNSAEFTRGLFVVNFLTAIGLLFGFKTRVMTFLCLVLAWSLQICNPFVLTAGHILLRMMLMWGVFLPLGAIWSADEKMRRKRRGQAGPKFWQVTSIASAGIMLQLAFVYFFSGLAKLNPDWYSGHALELAMNLEMYVKPIGMWLSEYPTLMRCATFATIGMEIALPILIFVPGISQFVRGAAMAMFIFLHIGIWMSMSIGIFSLVAMFSWFVFVPSDAWNAWNGEPIGYGTDRPRKKQSLEGGIATGMTTGLLLFVTLINIANTNPAKSSSWFGTGMRRIANLTMTLQEFKMFSTLPKQSPWFEYVGTLKDGQVVELFGNTEGHVADEKPKSVYYQMQTQHWRRLHFNLINASERALMYEQANTTEDQDETLARLRKNLLDQIVERWNRVHSRDQQVSNARLIMHLEPIELTRTDQEGSAVETQRQPTSHVWASYVAPEDQ